MLDCDYWLVYLLCLHSMSYMCVFRSVFGLFSAVLVGSSWTCWGLLVSFSLVASLYGVLSVT